MRCPYNGSEDVEAVKSWEMPKMGYRVTHYRCRRCGGLFAPYIKLTNIDLKLLGLT